MVSGLCCQKTMKNTGNFIYILRCWPGYSMLSTVTSKTMDTQGFKNFTRQSFGSRCSAASSPDSAFLDFQSIPAFSVKDYSIRQA